ncbi:MAG: zinc-dependent metalloprotease [Oligoflexales bacterium]
MHRLEKVLWLAMLQLGFLFLISACGNHKDSVEKAFTIKTLESEQDFYAPRNIKDSFVLSPPSVMDVDASTGIRSFILDQKTEDLKDPRQPKHENNNSFIPPYHPEGLQTLGIKKASLDKEFLLRTNLIQGGLAPDFHNLKSRIVAFTLKSGRLFLVEATQGHAYYHDLPQQLILTDFEIDHEDQETIYFNFNSGMGKLYTLEDWYAQDFSGSDPAHFSEQFEAVKIANSYSETVSFNEEKEYLFVKQIAQIQESNAFLPVEVRYYFHPYEPSKDFVPTVSPKNKKNYGFFEVNPTISHETKKARTFASKFNINKPVVFAISHNTPADYRDTIKEGILYWNKALGQEFIKVVDAPKGLTAPQYDYNMVQWIDWDDASHAYADAQMDPRTGEILNVQIYMSSVFAIKGKQQAREAIRKLLASHSNEIETSSRSYLEQLIKGNEKDKIRSYLQNIKENQSRKRKIGLRGFFQKPMCNHSHLESLALTMSELLNENLSDEVFFEVSKDHLRDAIAHEVGHTLGLRHNFAGSLAGNFSLDERDKIFAQYVQNIKTPDNLIVTSSIMDYMPFQESAIAGNQVKNGKSAFSYDEMAIKILYNDKTISDFENIPLFCTDSHTNRYVDCKVWDIGPSPIAYSKYMTDKNLKDFPKMLAEYFISNSKSLEPDEEPLPFDHVLMPSIRWSINLLNPRLRALESLIRGSRSLRLDREYGYVSEGNSEKINERFASWISEDLKTYGDGKWSNILDGLPKNYGNWVTNEFSKLIQSNSYRSGIGPGGSYNFTESEIEMMCKAVAEYMEEMEQSLAVVDTLQLYIMENISNQELKTEGKDLDDGFVSYLKDKAKEIIFTQKEIEDEKGPMKEFQVGLLEVQAKAKVEANTQREYLGKMLLIKTIMEKIEIPSFVVDDQEYAKTYSEDELNLLATNKLNAQLEELLAQIDLSQVFPEETSEPNQDEDEQIIPNQSEELEENQLDYIDDPMELDDEMSLSEKIDLDIRSTNLELNRQDHIFSARSDANLRKKLIAKKQSISNQWNQTIMGLNGNESDLSETDSEIAVDDTSSIKTSYSEEEETKPYSIDVPVAIYMPILLPTFKYKFETRYLASQLLDTKKGNSLAFGMKDRDKLADQFTKLYNHHLRNFKIKGKLLSRQQKNINTWIQKNEKIIANLSDTNFLSSLLGF